MLVLTGRNHLLAALVVALSLGVAAAHASVYPDISSRDGLTGQFRGAGSTQSLRLRVAGSSIQIAVGPTSTGAGVVAIVSGNSAASAEIHVAQGSVQGSCDGNVFAHAENWEELTDPSGGIGVSAGQFSDMVGVDTDKAGRFTLCAILWNGLSSPNGPLLAASTSDFTVVDASVIRPPTHPRVSSLLAVGDMKPRSRVTLTYDAENNVDLTYAGRGQDQRERVTIYFHGVRARQVLTSWHRTPAVKGIEFTTLSRPGSYRWCVAGIGRDGREGQVVCSAFATKKPNVPSGVGKTPSPSPGGGACQYGAVALQLVGVGCAKARTVLDNYLTQGYPPTGWACAPHQCIGPADFTGLRVHFLW